MNLVRSRERAGNDSCVLERLLDRPLRCPVRIGCMACSFPPRLWSWRRASARRSPAERLWTPPWMQAFSSNGSVHVVRCSRLSGLLMRQDIRRWPVWRYADRVQNRPRGLQRAMSGHWFSRSRLVDRLPLHALRPAHIPDDFRPTSTSSGRRQLRSAVALLSRHYRPGDARHSVGQCDGNNHLRLARQHPGQP